MKLIFPVGDKQRTAVFEWLLLIFLVLGYFAWLSTNTVYSASANGRLVDVFEDDEYQEFYILRQALTAHTLYIKWSVYGHFYFNLVLLPLIVLQHFTPISDQVIILALRYVATLSSALTVILTFGLARRYFSKPAAWVSSLLLTILPFIFNYWSVTAHPDTLQMLTVVGCLFGCCEFVTSKRKEWLIVAAVCAGLAFSTKYIGVFLLPIIWLLCLVPFEELRMAINLDFLRLPRLQSSIRLVIITGLSFLFAFVLTSPSLFLDRQFVNGITLQAKSTNFGYVFQTNKEYIEWFEVLSSSSLLGMLNSILLALALISFLAKGWKTKGKEFFSHKGLLWTWVLFYFTYAFFRVNLRMDRYLLVILPFIFILLGTFLTDGLEYLRGRFSGNFAYYFVIGIMVAVGGMQVWGGFTRQLGLITERTTRENNNPVIEAGLWLEANYPSSTRILYDKYSYIPPKFTRIQGSYGMDSNLIESFHPRIIVINSAIRDIYKDRTTASSYTEGAEKYMESFDFYNSVEEQELGYILVKDFGRVKIYEKE